MASAITGSDRSLKTISTLSDFSVGSRSARSEVSVLSLNRGAPTMEVKQSLDLEALKTRYINEITSAPKVAGDRRLDDRDVSRAVETLDGARPSLVAVGCAVAAAAA